MAYTFFNQYDGSSFPRTAQLATWSSGLYTLQTDLTKHIVTPFYAQDFVDGTGNANNAANAQYSIRTAVPMGCRGFIPYYYFNVSQSSVTNGTGNVTITATHSSATKLGICFYGRFGNTISPYQNNPYTVGASLAVDPTTYGYWKMLGNTQITSSSGGTANIVAIEGWDPKTPNSTMATLGGTSNLNRTLISHVFGGVSTTINSYVPHVAAPIFGTVGTVTMDTGAIPTLGASEIVCFLNNGTSGATTTAVTITQGTVGSHGIACSFVS